MTSTTQLTPFRYETPTVTLAVMARTAAVSQWSEVPVVQVLHFQLQLQGLSNESPIVDIQGDRAAFIALHQAVQSYVQIHLQTPLTALDAPFKAARDRSSDKPYLQSQGLTCHELYLGQLKTRTGASTIVLGAVQLADLSTVFEQLDTQVRLLPVALTPVVRRRPWRQWSAMAAGLVAAVGLTTALWPLYQSRQFSSETALEAPLADPTTPTIPPRDLEQSPAPQEDLLPEALPSASAPLDPADTANTTDAANTNTANTDTESDVDTTDINDDVDAGAAPLKTKPADPVAPDTSETQASKPEARTPAPANAQPAPPPAAAPILEPEIASSSLEQAAPETDSPETTAGAASDSVSLAEVPETLPDPNDGPNDEVSRSVAPRGDESTSAPSLAALQAEIADRWVPLDGVDESLTYTLTLTVDGTLAEIIPANEVANRYRDRAGLPAIGSPLVSPGNVRPIQVMLFSTGDVTVFQLDGEEP